MHKKCISKKQLKKAVYEGNSKEVERLLNKYNMDIETRFSYKRTLLHCACEIGNLDVVKMLLKHGADVNAKASGNMTPLHCSLIFIDNNPAKVEIVQLLLKQKNIDVNVATNSHNITPLLLVCDTPYRWAIDSINVKHNILTIAAQLIEKGAEINIQSFLGETPLHTACKSIFIELANLLVENGALIDIKNNNNHTPLELIRTENAEKYRKEIRAKRDEYLKKDFRDNVIQLWNTSLLKSDHYK